MPPHPHSPEEAKAEGRGRGPELGRLKPGLLEPRIRDVPRKGLCPRPMSTTPPPQAPHSLTAANTHQGWTGIIQGKAEWLQPPATQAPGLPCGPWPRTRAPGERHQAPKGRYLGLVSKASSRYRPQWEGILESALGRRKRRPRLASKAGIRHKAREDTPPAGPGSAETFQSR